MKIHLLSGFLGSGKTTAIKQAAHSFIKKGIKTGVITNDQGSKLVDGGLFKSLAIPNREVINGCFCCNYNDLDAGIASLIELNGTEIIFAESVGSCTDIVATVLKPLLQFRPGAQVTVSVFADVRLLRMILIEGASSFDEDVRYIYLKQLEEAGIIVVNKIDLIDAAQLAVIKNILQKKYGSKILLYQNSLDADSIAQWLQVLENYTSADSLQSLKINYDMYAEGEAKLAWVDQEVEIFSLDFRAMQQAEKLVNTIYKATVAGNYPIGHIKFLVNDSLKISFTSATDPLIALPVTPAGSATVLINMRVQAAPGILSALIEDGIKETESADGCRIVVNSLSAFQPGYPRPVYRM